MLCLKGPESKRRTARRAQSNQASGGGKAVIHAVDLPGTENRIIVEIPKIDRSDKRLPRPASMAKGKSL